MDRISWDQYFMAQSHLLSLRSTCPRLMVGATIVRDKRIIAGGYNGSVSGEAHCLDDGCMVVDNHCIRTIHAEINALLQCSKFGVPTEGSELYVTHFPCVHCSKSIIQAGIQRVYYAKEYKNDPYAEQIFQAAGVDLIAVELDEAILDRKYQDKLNLTVSLLKELEKTDVSEDVLQDLLQQTRSIYTKS